MTIVPTNYTDAAADTATLIAEMKKVSDSITSAIARLNAAPATLNMLAQPAPTGYLSLIDYVNAQVVLNPSDEAFLALQVELAKIVNDFGSKATYVQALITAVAAVPAG